MPLLEPHPFLCYTCVPGVKAELPEMCGSNTFAHKYSSARELEVLFSPVQYHRQMISLVSSTPRDPSVICSHHLSTTTPL